MRFFSKRQLPLVFVAAVLLAVVGFLYLRPTPMKPEPDAAVARGLETDSPPLSLSILAAPPDWTLLEVFQNSITREEFERLLTTVFTTGEAWRKVIEIDETEARIVMGTSSDEESFRLHFAPPGLETRAPRHWRSATELPAANPGLPLAGLHIAIDPGHIGGEWAKMEERWFVVGDGAPVEEGTMTLHVANLLKPRLEALGATISLVRDSLEPVTTIRPEALRRVARDSSKNDDTPAALQRLAERLFYRTAEIRARADLVNQTLRPDLVLCLHFNAEGWGDPDAPTLVAQNHFHLLLNGAYTDEEITLSDQRFAMLQKLLQRTHAEEAKVGATVAEAFAEISGLPAYNYPPDSRSVRRVSGHPYLWARNLLANRLYDCPVIFMEPYVMNSIPDHARIQAGDYEGLRAIHGTVQPSIFQEYADALVEGLARHYSASRTARH